MSTFLTLDKPMTTDVATVAVEPKLAPGDYIVRLTVVSARGVQSAPAVLKLTVRGAIGIPPPRPPRPPPAPVIAPIRALSPAPPTPRAAPQPRPAPPGTTRTAAKPKPRKRST